MMIMSRLYIDFIIKNNIGNGRDHKIGIIMVIEINDSKD